MGFSTFSGPLRAGSQKDAGPTRNTGLVLLTRSVVVPAAVITTAPAAQNLMVLPAGSKIAFIDWETLVAFSGGGVTAIAFQLGRLGGTANLYYASTSLAALTAGKLARATSDAQQQVASTNNVGTADVTITGTFTATTGNPTAGSAVLTVYYIQRNEDGSQDPLLA